MIFIHIIYTRSVYINQPSANYIPAADSRSFGCGFRKAFARFDGRRITDDVADQAILLRAGDQSLVHELRKIISANSAKAREPDLVRAKMSRGRSAPPCGGEVAGEPYCPLQ